ncbi:MAG: DUF3276 family protein [Bacteroidota bacterium]
MEGNENREKDEIFAKVVRAGKRTYFFDVKTTKGNEYYITVTESKKRFTDDGKFVYEKHKLFLYKEDFDKFMDSLNEAVDFVKKEQPYTPPADSNSGDTNKFSNVNFDDLDK